MKGGLRQINKMSDCVDDQDDMDIRLAHTYRLSLSTVPRQSSFRVVAVIFYEVFHPNDDKDDDLVNGKNNNGDEDGNNTVVERLHVVGSNDEPCCISGSICAERAALLQLRFIPHMKRISKVVISTDALHPLYPGMLCREFLSSHPHTHPDLRIVMAGSKCTNCHLDIRTGQQRDISKLEAPCTNSSTHHHDWAPIETTLADIYPHPSPYTRLTASEAFRMGEQFADANTDEISDERIEPPPSANTNLSQEEQLVEDRNEKLLGQAVLASQHDNRTDLHPIRYGAAVLFSDGTISTAHQKKALEYGCSLDAVTQLIPSIDEKSKQELPIYPTLLIQADQFGIVHPPFAVARAFLSEHGYENCGILVHNTFDTNNFLKVVRVKDLAPSAPDMGALWGN